MKNGEQTALFSTIYPPGGFRPNPATRHWGTSGWRGLVPLPPSKEPSSLYAFQIKCVVVNGRSPASNTSHERGLATFWRKKADLSSVA